ncbi:Cupredoxin [Hyaloraphidium curvatum]|nr:Cupredoxin [Hyaloraphidium curvatum]
MSRPSLALLLSLLLLAGSAASHIVHVGVGGTPNPIQYYDPVTTISAGDTVVWNWTGPLQHSVTQTTAAGSCVQWGPGFDSGPQMAPFSYAVYFITPGTYHYFCRFPGHCEAGMVGQIIVT